MQEWRKSLYESLRDFSAPRVVSFSDLTSLANVANVKSVRRFVVDAEELGTLFPVRKGLWLNNLANPTPTAPEAACHLRTGAVVSLQSVLGDAGVLNNYTGQVFCVVPISETGSGPNLKTASAAGTVYHFSGIKESVLNAGETYDRLSALVPYPRATAEAALVHWLYLAQFNQSISEPDTQCDVSLLDIDRLERLATAVGLEERAMDWVDRCSKRETLDDDQVGWSFR